MSQKWQKLLVLWLNKLIECKTVLISHILVNFQSILDKEKNPNFSREKEIILST